MSDDPNVREPQLERESRRLGRSGRWFLTFGLTVGVPGIVLIIFGHGWVFALGLALVAIAAAPAIVAAGLLISSAVGHWASRHRPFA
jgi:hypothetical protein